MELHQEMATSSRNSHIIKKQPLHQKTLFFDEVTFFDEFRITGTFSMVFHIELDELPFF